MRLPANCTKQYYAIAKLADSTPATPEIAASVIMGVIRFSQVERGVGFNEAMASLKKFNPEVFSQLKKVKL